MTPASVRHTLPEKRCGNCKHSYVLYQKIDYVCMHGEADLIEMHTVSHGVVNIEGDYLDVLHNRVIRPLDQVCDEWEERRPAT